MSEIYRTDRTKIGNAVADFIESLADKLFAKVRTYRNLRGEVFIVIDRLPPLIHEKPIVEALTFAANRYHDACEFDPTLHAPVQHEGPSAVQPGVLLR